MVIVLFGMIRQKPYTLGIQYFWTFHNAMMRRSDVFTKLAFQADLHFIIVMIGQAVVSCRRFLSLILSRPILKIMILQVSGEKVVPQPRLLRWD
jgi:hypothetical protein